MLGHNSMQVDTPHCTDKHRDSRTESGSGSGDLKIHYQSRRMGDLEDKSELKMFQRRERKRDDDRGHDSRHGSSRSWRDSDFSERSSSGKDASRSVASLEYEPVKKSKESSERSDRPWKEKETYERRHKDVSHKDKDDYHSKNSWHRDKSTRDSAYKERTDRSDHSWKDRGHKDRLDHSSKERTHRDREDRSHAGHRDWDSRDYSRDRDHERVKRPSEMNDSSLKSRNTQGRGEERNSSEPSRSGNGSTEHNHGSLAQRSSGVTSTGGYESNSQVENTSGVRSGSSAVQKQSGHEKSLEQSNEKSVGDARPIPKLKLKVTGITQGPPSDGKKQPESGDSLEKPRPTPKKRSTPTLESSKRRHRLILQEDSDEDGDGDLPINNRKEPVPPSEEDGFLAYLANDPSYRKTSVGNSYASNNNLQGVRKSSRIPKKRVFDGDDDVDLEPKRRRKKKVEVDSDEDLYRIEEDEVEHDLLDEDEVDPVTDGKAKSRRRKSLITDMSGGEPKKSAGGAGKVALLTEMKTGVPLTARQRALQSSKDGSSEATTSLIEFPEGLTHSGSKKQKEVLTAAERQLKKEEAAQKRRQQVEKAAKEIQAVAIQKILCQDSQRKKREGKLQKQREELEQEKKAAAMAPATNSIRWVFGPSGVVVSFSQDLELPKIFSGPLSYPQERERCAGPSCNNTYKYRDSKTQLPLCSLQCYKAIQKPTEAALAH